MKEESILSAECVEGSDKEIAQDIPGVLCASKVPLQGLVVVQRRNDKAARQHIVTAQPIAEVGHQHKAHVSAVVQQLESA